MMTVVPLIKELKTIEAGTKLLSQELLKYYSDESARSLVM
jgi:hypothetical protein